MEKTAAQLTDEYLQLGGTRKSANDDNRTSIRKWDQEPNEAQSYWEKNIARLDEAKLKEIETLLPSISSGD